MLTIANKKNMTIPQGDTGTAVIHMPDGTYDDKDRVLFTIADSNGEEIIRREYSLTDGAFTLRFENSETRDLKVAKYTWEVRYIDDATHGDDGAIDGGKDIDTPMTGDFTVTRTYGRI